MIWCECLVEYGGFWLFGVEIGIVDVMYVLVVMCFLIYDVKFELDVVEYCMCVFVYLFVVEWIDVVKVEYEDIDEFDMEF